MTTPRPFLRVPESLPAGATLASLEADLAAIQAVGDRRRAVAHAIRFATALQYANEHARAEEVFRFALAASRAEAVHEDYALQHFGKCLVEMGRIDEAIPCFARALGLREARGAAELVASSREALEAARSLAAEMPA